MKTFTILFFLQIFIIFLVLITISSSQETRDAEIEALLRWKESLLSSNPGLDIDVLDSWSLTNRENLCNNWNGIRCNTDGVVSSLFLADPGINGTLEQFNFSSFPNLISFDLSFNSLTGSIPSEIGTLTELQFLNLEENRITGTIPYQISNLQKLSVLNLASNHLETPDWSKFKSMPFLKMIYLRNNKLNGKFPDFVLNSRNLTHLDFSSNNFNGFIPELFSNNLGKLEYINLFSNSFEGPLSSILTELPKLLNIQRLYLGNNLFEGEIPSSIGQHKNLSQLELSHNSLTKNLPFSLSNLTGLSYLVVSHNILTGEIPSALGNITNLETLDLSSNKLVGRIPSELVNLTFLRELNLSYNHLEGPIPQGGNFLSFDNSSYIGNFALCGSPLTKNCDDH